MSLLRSRVPGSVFAVDRNVRVRPCTSDRLAEAVARLAGGRTKAASCIDVLKDYGDKVQIARGRFG